MARTGLDQNRIFVSKICSIDWQSLTFTGERHEISLRLPAPEAADALARLRDGSAEAEWALKGHVVADILIVDTQPSEDGSILVDLEALTLSD